MGSGMKTVYVVLTDTGTLFTRLIRLVTKAPYNHASLALDVELGELYSFGRKHLRLPWNAGFVRERRDAGIYVALKRTTCIVYELRLDEERFARIAREVERFEREGEHYAYNFIGLLNFVFPTRLRKRDAYFCSEFVATVLRRGGVELLGKPPAMTAPHDFMSAPSLRPVYEGPLAAYRMESAAATLTA